MQEKLLYYLWQNQLFDKSNLQTTSRETISVHRPGYLNRYSGPDFNEAKIEIEGLTWNGQVEIHVKSSEWESHRHQMDDLYNSVILHVVWEKDRDIFRADGTEPPTLELSSIADSQIVRNHSDFLSSPNDIVCKDLLDDVDLSTIQLMIEKSLIERLEMKSHKFLKILTRNGGDWEKSSIEWMISKFGFRANRDVFEEFASKLDLDILQKIRRSPARVEPFLFGQAGMLLGRSKDDYQNKLKIEYKYLSSKHGLKDLAIKENQWKLGSLRPANFPTIRIAQLASILSQTSRLFSDILSIESLQQMVKYFRRPLSPYWNSHVLFGTSSGKGYKYMGRSSAEILVLNMVAPVLAAYSTHTQDTKYMERAIGYLEDLSAEKNRIIRKWEEIGVEVGNAAQSQGLIHMYNAFCTPKNCLNCGIGHRLLNKIE